MTTVKAYTILEVLVAMVVASIIISFSYLGLHIVNNQLYTCQKNTSGNMQAAVLHQVLWSDFDHCNYATKDGNSINFIGKNGRIVTYAFGETVIRHSGEITDTFNIQPQDFQAKGYTVSIQNVNSSLINEISFKITMFSDQLNVHFAKLYTTETLLTFTPVKFQKLHE